jgi:hypothetical protein
MFIIDYHNNNRKSQTSPIPDLHSFPLSLRNITHARQKWLILIIMMNELFPRTWGKPSQKFWISLNFRQCLMRESWVYTDKLWIKKFSPKNIDLPLLLWVRISIRARCTTLCDQVCQWLATCQWLSLGSPVSSTNKTDRHDITEILLKMAFKHQQTNTTLQYLIYWYIYSI